MGARHHRDLESWQLANQVRSVILELTNREYIKTDFDFCDQARFARYMNIVKGSLGELLDSTDEALQKRYIRKPEYEKLNLLIGRALKAAGGLHAYLIDNPTPPRKKKRKREELPVRTDPPAGAEGGSPPI